ncbi:hypothetical protein GQF03_03510 [Sneathiella chungangensis]|uniref:Lipoprotein n=1 Tax=Sneathiella chungangensis TaxID=1418234 RepID=A0A845MDD9_9PROT|nr:OprD family porin [Sneathiella chungangensis]MZR21390.1 hypothetical protein [Sneathiella chungangensis]
MQTIRSCCVLLLAVLVTGCASLTNTEIHTSPEVSLNSSFQRAPDKPILISVIDHDAAKREGDFGPVLINEINRIYPNAFQVVPPSTSSVAGSVSMQIHVRRLGGFFNDSTLSVLRRSGYKDPVSGDADEWQQVILEAKSEQPVISGYVGGPYGIIRGWSGIAFIDIKVHDLRFDRPHIFTISIAAERSTLNNFGFITAQMNAAEAWEDVEPRLARFLDAAVQKVAAEQYRQVSPPKPNKSGSYKTI